MARPGIALQLYTLRNELRADLVGTLRTVAEIGYRAVELAGAGGMSASDLKATLDSLGLRAISAHVGLDRLETSLASEVEFQAELGNHDVVCPSLPPQRRADEAGWHHAAEALNRIGQRCRELGARFSYHNHAFEFEPVGSTTGLEILLGETDPTLVHWEPDVYWIAFARQDPAAWLRRYAARCPLVHLKDMTRGDSPTFAEVGEGVLDFASIFAAATSAEWYVVEQDATARPAFESVALSLRHLREWGFA